MEKPFFCVAGAILGEYRHSSTRNQRRVVAERLWLVFYFMAQAQRDQNHVPSWFGVSSVDGVTPTLIAINESNGGFMFEDGVSTMPVMALLPIPFPREENHLPTIGGVSSDNPNLVIPLSVNPATGAIMVQTT